MGKISCCVRFFAVVNVSGILTAESRSFLN